MTNFKKQKRLCRNCKRVWFTPLFEAHWVHCVTSSTPAAWPPLGPCTPSDKRKLLARVMNAQEKKS
jgi:hypothetical protein